MPGAQTAGWPFENVPVAPAMRHSPPCSTIPGPGARVVVVVAPGLVVVVDVDVVDVDVVARTAVVVVAGAAVVGGLVATVVVPHVAHRPRLAAFASAMAAAISSAWVVLGGTVCWMAKP